MSCHSFIIPLLIRSFNRRRNPEALPADTDGHGLHPDGSVPRPTAGIPGRSGGTVPLDRVHRHGVQGTDLQASARAVQGQPVDESALRSAGGRLGAVATVTERMLSGPRQDFQRG